MELLVNYWVIIFAAILNVILGAVWYGPLFGKQWMRLAGIEKPEHMTPHMKQRMYRSYVIMAIASLVMVYVLVHFLAYSSIATHLFGVDAAIMIAVWAWIGFVVPSTIGSVLWEGRPWKYWCITSGYFLVALMIDAVLLMVWR